MQRDWLEKDFYKTLGVSESASEKEITKAYRKLAREFHPDANQDNPKAEERFKEISAAYDVVGDTDKRKEYDEVRRMGPGAFGGGFGGPGGGGGPGGFTFNMNDVGGFGDLFGSMFGGAGRRSGRGGSTGAGPQRGQDVDATLTLSFEDAVHGLTTTLHLTADAQCSTCHGSGARPGTMPQRCATCQGRGVTSENQGMFGFSQPCRQCSGTGQIIEHPCTTCRGSGVERRPREVNVRIPAGVQSGQRIRIKGRGTPGRNGGPAGDLFVECSVQPHPIFGRDANNLTVRVPITFSEAALGATIHVPTLAGSSVALRVKPGTQSGSRHRVRGKGVETSRETGDLIVTVDVVVPTHLSEAEEAALQQFAAATTMNPRAHLGV